jgi:ATP-dependent Clp protease ATP-binding subunit ClpX
VSAAPPASPNRPRPAADLRPLETITPTEILSELRKSVLGQDEVLRAVALAVFKHATGRVPGHILLIGNSGTGKTSIMAGLQRLYNDVPEYAGLRAMAITNANLLVDAERLEFRPERVLAAIEQRARATLGHPPSAQELQRAMESATLCIDEIDKMSTLVAGKPNPIGIVLQQGLLTLMEGSRVTWRTRVLEKGEEKPCTLELRTDGMMFLCGGAFEGLYDQVYARVTAPGSGESSFSTMVRGADGQLRIEKRFGLADYFKIEDLYQYGMVPQFVARFESVPILADLDLATLQEILLRSSESPLARSRRYFEMLGIDLTLEDLAASLIAEQAQQSARTGARALRPVFAKVIQALEFDPWGSGSLQPKESGGLQLTVTAEMVRQALSNAASRR